MAADRASYDVDWQLEDDILHPGILHPGQVPGEAAGTGRASAPHPAHQPSESELERLSQVARFGALLAEADLAAVVTYVEHALVVECTSGHGHLPATGARLVAHPSSGTFTQGPVRLLLSGQLRWCRALPPEGFRQAYLVAAPSLSPSGRLLLVANHNHELTQLNLRLVAAYLAQLYLPAPPAPQPATPAGA